VVGLNHSQYPGDWSYWNCKNRKLGREMRQMAPSFVLRKYFHTFIMLQSSTLTSSESLHMFTNVDSLHRSCGWSVVWKKSARLLIWTGVGVAAVRVNRLLNTASRKVRRGMNIVDCWFVIRYSGSNLLVG
jgi:hypothetical protein